MKLASALLAVVGISITPLVLADIKMCKPAQIEKLVTKLVSKGKTGVHDCQAASGGFSIFPPSSQPPTNDQLKLMCTSDACLDLVTEFLHGDLIDCDIKWGGVSLNPHLLVSKFKESCEKLSAAHDEKKWLDWSSYRKTVPVEIVYESEMKSKTKTPAVDWVERNPYQPKEPKEPKSSPAPALAPPPSSKYEPYHPTPQPKEKYSTPTPSIDEGYDHDESKKEQYPTPAPGYPKCNNLYQPEGAPWTKDTYTAPSPSHHSYKEDTPSKPEEHQYVTPEPESSYSVEDTYSDVKVQEQPQHQPEQLPKSSSTPSVDKHDSSYPMKSSPVEVYATPAPVLAPAPVDKYPSTWSQETSASPHKGKYAEYLSDDDDDNDDVYDQKSKEEKHGGEKPSEM